ncbi:MAG TPA: hypothetical protein VGW31_02760, partial [Hanamia sp.]|nr:hypothetical protein [Hanamia sp.]
TAETATSTIEINQSTALFLKSIWEDSGADITVFQAKLEQWFNDTMERATGWYKKYTRVVLFVIGLFVAIAFNVDSLAIRRILTTNRTAREQMVKMAIESKDHLNPDNLLNGDNRRLDSTYKLVASDAEKSNDVLGLGRPWIDTSNMWKDSMASKDFTKRMTALEKENSTIQDSIGALNDTLNTSGISLKGLADRKDASSPIIADSIRNLKQFIQKNSNALKALLSDPQALEYQQMLQLKQRGEYIMGRRANKWFLYSPNQAGGWETFFGWIITALAITLGAPFWFDLLSKLISLRGTGTKIDTEDSGQPKSVATTRPASAATPSTNNNADQEAVG